MTVELSTQRLPAAFKPLACHCGFCRRHGASMISDPAGTLTLRTTCDPRDVYSMGLDITDFHVCGRCGVFVGATWRENGMALGVTNILALEDAHQFTGTVTAANFDGEDVPARTGRRRANWTPTIVLPSGSNLRNSSYTSPNEPI